VSLSSSEKADKSAPSILVIDSGVGGLSICRSILALDSRLQLIYFADDAYFPYGLKSDEQLRRRLIQIVSQMLDLHQPELVVLACNTVSTLLLPELRALFDVPFVGVVPAIKPAAKLSRTKSLGLLATPGTVKRPYTDKLIADYASDCEVLRVGSSELVSLAEGFLSGHEVSEFQLSSILLPFTGQESQVDTIVLGCTHFPLLKAHLSKILPGIQWVDSGEAIASRVLSLLSSLESCALNYYPLDPSDHNNSRVHQIYFSGTKPDEFVFARALESLGIFQHQLNDFSFTAFEP